MMMKTSMRLVSLVMMSTFFLAGCSYTPARIDAEPIIEIGDGHHDHKRGGGSFCPPGQAKKGNC
ncbi:hypothetical protein [Cobetia marina]|uniref:hypothetical protein n=1 Tax=Cobetia marina TaxID=28258 RepID=UPI00254683A3|nr:hypothetical protein [Cobetia pacifica]MDI6002426.1 hypothetical protein [Cobetia pacifica]